VPSNIRLYCIEVLIYIYMYTLRKPSEGDYAEASGLTALGWWRQGNLKTLDALLGWNP
jgi:hypothetical protein